MRLTYFLVVAAF